jgi:hypothetical protein
MSDWKEALPEALREAPYIAKAETAEEAVASLAHAAKIVGTSIRIPGEDASEDDRAAFYDKLGEVDGVARLPTHDDEDGWNALMGKLGRPDEYTGYELPEVADFKWEEGMATDLRKYALESGLTNKQFKALASQLATQNKTEADASLQSLADARESLKLEWGDTLQSREELVRGWMSQSEAPAALQKLFDDKAIDNDTMNWLYKTANQFKGEVAPIAADGNGGAAPLMQPSEALEKIPQVIGDMLGMRDSDPRYRGLQQKLIQLQTFASSEQQA